MYHADSVGESRWKLGCVKDTVANGSDKTGVAHQCFAGPALLRIDDPDLFAHLKPDNPERLSQVRVVGDQHSGVVLVLIRIAEEVTGDVHIGSLLFGLEDFGKAGSDGGRIDQGEANRVREEMPHDHLEVGNCPESTDVCTLADRLVGVGAACTHDRSEVLQAGDLTFLGQQQLTHPGDIQPAEGGAPDRAVVEIESVDVDVCSHEKSRGHYRSSGLAAHTEVWGGLNSSMIRGQRSRRARNSSTTAADNPWRTRRDSLLDFHDSGTHCRDVARHVAPYLVVVHSHNACDANVVRLRSPQAGRIDRFCTVVGNVAFRCRIGQNRPLADVRECQ